MQGQPDRIGRHRFHPVPGIGGNQKKVAGLQRRIPAGIKPEHGDPNDQHHPLRILLVIPEPFRAGLAVGDNLFQSDAGQVEEGAESLRLPRRGFHEVFDDQRHLLPIPDNGNHFKRDGTHSFHGTGYFRSVLPRRADGKLRA